MARTRTAIGIFLLAFAFAAAPTGIAPPTCPVDTTADFTDNCYHEYLLYNVDYEPDIEVLIMPSASPFALRDHVVIQQSIDMWDAGINALGPAWLANGINLHHYSVGIDYVPEEAWWDPEIVIIPSVVTPLSYAGIGQQIPFDVCHGLPPPTSLLGFDLPELAEAVASSPGLHRHATESGYSMGVLTTECDSGGSVCFVIYSGPIGTGGTTDMGNLRDLFDLNSHELGHCLGVGHVGDALDFSAIDYPEDDIMSYENDGQNPAYVLCVSTLNIEALKQVYGDLRGQAGYSSAPAGGYAHQLPTSWSPHACTQPTITLWTDLQAVRDFDPI